MIYKILIIIIIIINSAVRNELIHNRVYIPDTSQSCNATDTAPERCTVRLLPSSLRCWHQIILLDNRGKRGARNCFTEKIPVVVMLGLRWGFSAY